MKASVYSSGRMPIAGCEELKSCRGPFGRKTSVWHSLWRSARFNFAAALLFFLGAGCTTYKETVHVKAFIENVGVGLGTEEEQAPRRSYQEKPEPITPPSVQTL
jgi:hypothetical protein